MKRIELSEAIAPLGRYVEDIGDGMLVVTVGGRPAYALVPLAGSGTRHLPEGVAEALRAAAGDAPADTVEEPPAGAASPVSIYTDGGCIGNPGPGGYGAVILEGDRRREVQGGFRHTTNNRMEIMAAIEALAALPGKRTITIYSDSQYLVNAMSKGWARRWQAKGWMRTPTERALNPDLWQRLLDLCKRHDVSFRWVRGHVGNPENERAHHLSVEATRAGTLPVDPGFAG